jgi:hypothetical protein
MRLILPMIVSLTELSLDLSAAAARPTAAVSADAAACAASRGGASFPAIGPLGAGYDPGGLFDELFEAPDRPRT